LESFPRASLPTSTAATPLFPLVCPARSFSSSPQIFPAHINQPLRSECPQIPGTDEQRAPRHEMNCLAALTMAKRYDAPVDTRIARYAIFGRISMFCAARAAICGKEAATDNASTLPRLNRECEQREPCHSTHLDVCFSKRRFALQRMGWGGLHRLLAPGVLYCK
jgi:hypothetical protein